MVHKLPKKVQNYAWGTLWVHNILKTVQILAKKGTGQSEGTKKLKRVRKN
jgi:hypothetical protein